MKESKEKRGSTVLLPIQQTLSVTVLTTRPSKLFAQNHQRATTQDLARLCFEFCEVRQLIGLRVMCDMLLRCVLMGSSQLFR